MISWLVAQEAKHMVPKLDSYWQDTPNALRDLTEENRKGPQPDNAILVTADVVGANSSYATTHHKPSRYIYWLQFQFSFGNFSG